MSDTQRIRNEFEKAGLPLGEDEDFFYGTFKRILSLRLRAEAAEAALKSAQQCVEPTAPSALESNGALQTRRGGSR